MKPSTILALFASFAAAVYAAPAFDDDEGPLSLMEMFERDGLFPEDDMSPAENLVELDERAANPPWNINFYSGPKCRPSISQTANTVPQPCSKVPFGPARSYLFQNVNFWDATLYKTAKCTDAGTPAHPGNSCHRFAGQFVAYKITEKKK